MNRRRRLLSALLLSGTMTFAAPAHAAEPPPARAFKVLVFSKTAGYVHDAVPAAVKAIQELGETNGFEVDETKDAAAFTPENLAGYQAVVFASTTGDVLDAAQQEAFEDFIREGGGYAGIHAAADTEYQWPFYGQLVGARFARHPAGDKVSARLTTEDRAHPSTAHLPATPWTWADEWYDYQTNPRTTARVLVTLDETSYTGGRMGDHPITWCKTVGQGRSWYTGMGHRADAYADPSFRDMLLGGIRYVAGAVKADCRPETGYAALTGDSLSGWTQAGPGGFTHADGTASSYGGMGLLWRPTGLPSNRYSLKLDWKMQGDDNSGVFVGFPDPAGNPWTAVTEGYEIQLDATDTPARSTGSIYNAQAPDLTTRDRVLNPPGLWNTLEIVVDAPRILVHLNGEKINDFTGDPRRLAGTLIGLQNSSAKDHISFRDVRIRSLDAPQQGPQDGRTYTLTSVSSGKLADVSSASLNDGAGVVQWPSTGGAHQRWTLRNAGEGAFTVLAGHSGKCLTVPANRTNINGALVEQAACSGGDNQKWVLEPVKTDVYRLLSVAGNKCLDVPGADTTSGRRLAQYSCGAGTNQQWKLTQLG
ncbi:ThuA domain-containing protein [Streptomyces sp. MSC1_001]|jgi:type 1 glutamine amidotransferase|uniref:ThuA domain-containing protein n=1 Tax=Streptomyces sp. MSC1_001 TaxID=2909263 RepID=UPI00202FC270|nr:ThuA domain-containing protein [Streptomyces sp. MSC1_001]